MSLIIQNTVIETLYSGIVVGAIIGAGICLSIAILLYLPLLKNYDVKLLVIFYCSLVLVG